MAGLVFYTNPMSRGRTVRWMLEEVGIPYEARVIAYGAPMRTPEYLAVNPMGKVPAISHRGVVVTESAAICAYLADAFPEAGLAPPPDSPARGPYYRWLFFGAGPFEAAITNASLGVTLDDPQMQGRVGYGSLARVLDTLAARLADAPYLAGDGFTAADIVTGGAIGFGLATGGIEDRPVFRDYVDRISARPAAARAREIDDALMPAPGA